jgi:hypothetical protein
MVLYKLFAGTECRPIAESRKSKVNSQRGQDYDSFLGELQQSSMFITLSRTKGDAEVEKCQMPCSEIREQEQGRGHPSRRTHGYANHVTRPTLLRSYVEGVDEMW